MLGAHADYCLAHMAISQWETRQIDYVCVSTETFDIAKQQLLVRLLQALHWPKERTQYLPFPVAIAKMQQLQPQYILYFGVMQELCDLPNTTILHLPSLSQLLHDKAAKKQAWELLRGHSHST